MPYSNHAQLLQIALQHHQAGRLTDALHLYRQILMENPHHAQTLHWMGVLAGQSGQREAAVEFIQRAIAVDAGVAIYHANLGKFLMDVGKPQEAAAACRAALAIQPELAEAHNNLGNALRAAGKSQEAIASFERAIALNRDFAEAHFNLGNALKDQQRLDESVASYQQALALKNDMAKTHNNMGIALAELGRVEEAQACYLRALEILPGYAEAHCNFGNLLKDQGAFAAAQQQYEAAIAARPDHREAHWNLALLLLESGELQRGWKEFEWRCRQMGQERGFSQPHWDGSPAPDKTVLLYTVGGFGDALHWVRLVEHVRHRAGRILVECPPELFPLFEEMGVADAVIARGQPLPPFDLHAPLQSLNGMLNISLETIPNKVPYLHAPEDRRRRLKGRVPKGGRLNVGLVWAGSTSDPKVRSGTLAVFEPLARVDGVTWFSLQKGPASQEPRPAGLDLIDFTPDLEDFADTAALVEQLDLVITVDTSMAHLAGGLGKPVWVLIPRQSDFRWLRERTDSPWYPTMRLFRQQTVGEWVPVVEAIAVALAESVAQKRISSP